MLINEYKSLSEKEKIILQNTLLQLNFSTIHSFARKTIKRFSTFIEIDPFSKIIDRKESDILFMGALIKTFANPEKVKIFYEISNKIKVNQFFNLVSQLRNLHPYVFLGKPLQNSQLTILLKTFYESVEKEYFIMKKELGYLDFDDLEKLTFEILTKNPNSLLVLEDFDEKMNFIFIDEFQDTNLLQWKIIEKLIEEWVSGWGSKAEKGEKYGIYIVGDKKQSIYKFRGAEKNVFEEAKKILQGYYEIEKLRKNYRSSKKIIDFINAIFKNDNDWREEELVYGGKIENLPSEIEIKFFKDKEKEYEWVCKKIITLLTKGNITVWDRRKNILRNLELRDFLILIRKRNKNFKLLEEKFKIYNIPYVVIGGIGFYQEPEIKFLLSLFFTLIDPTDDYSFWNIKNSVFKIDLNKIYKWRDWLQEYEISLLIEKILDEISFWNNLNTQQTANVEKFLSILQNQSYLPHHIIAKNLREILTNTQEPKADIFSIHQNAVKIMTIHGAKGLEFPVVFLLNLEDLSYSSTKDLFFYKKIEDGYVYVYKSESEEDFRDDFKNRMMEEENRLLYVALTRAMQYLFISGLDDKSYILQKIRKFINDYPGSEEE
ncbi:MAG: UvrD-helicase domain-containing protein, partial [bacterium]|nr:UvrD-helicase domain-containing protein [bacterium]